MFGLTTTGVLAYLGIRILGTLYEVAIQSRVKKFIKLHHILKKQIKRGIKNATRR